ncbi:unnamed protein product [Phyllotreta striolata]|uniref:Multidrug resistance-associated protein lethal(2)03659 n=1 Tax=Phyllotreta striolata TaxID=444603 RepID=A0A9N9TMD7_PHYSR|nr:unnamed protein product [Phyllotreta striolata]
MDVGFKLKRENPKKRANCLTKLFFGWMIETVRKGKNDLLELKDLYKALDPDKSERLTNKLEKHWNDEVVKAETKNKPPSLLSAIRKTFFLEFMLYGLMWFLINAIFRSSQPILLAKIIAQFSNEDRDYNDYSKYYYSAGLVGLTLFSVFLTHHMNFGLSKIGMRIRIACSSLIYRKLMRLNQTSLGRTAAGQVVNLLANDVARFDQALTPLHCIWVLPFQIVFLSWIIWTQVGIATVAGLVTLISVGVPLQGFLGKYIGRFRSTISKKTDRRVKLMNEIISGIQVIKMYVWENSFEAIVKAARADEIKTITYTSYLRGIFASCMVFLDRTALAITIMCYVLLGHEINASIVFSLAQAFNLLQNGVAIWFPMAVSQGAEALVSIRRLQEFLSLEELEEPRIEKTSKKGIILNAVNARWFDTPTLSNVSFNIPPGTLCAVVGPVGSGKSSLLQLLLGELPSSTGDVKIGGSISYCSQQPWLFYSTVRNNILFGRKYDRFLYEQVVRACALRKDFDQLPLGDKTVVGERGVALSGGQKARINLARAVYEQADIYLLDDPLSAVDTHVGKKLFDDCVDHYLKGRIRILVTHQLQYLKKADLIVVMNKGQVEDVGTFAELSSSKTGFSRLMAESGEANEINRVSEATTFDATLTTSSRKWGTTSMEVSKTIDYIEESQDVEEECGRNPNSKPLRKYLSATNHPCLLVILAILLVLAQALCACADYWVSYWTSEEEIRHLNRSSTTEIIEVHQLDGVHHNPSSYFYNYTPPGESFLDPLFDRILVNDEEYRVIKSNYAMYAYGALIAGSIVLTLARSFFFFKMCMISSVNLHSKIFHSLLKAPMRFFDTNPSGRILNRFSKDIGAVDEVLPKEILNVVQILLVLVGILANVIASNHYIVIAIIVLGALFMKLRNYYLLTAKTIKHLEGVTKSPVFSHVNSTINGITTIRASHAQRILIEEFDEHQDVHTSAWYLTIACTSTFGLWLDIVCSIFAASVIFTFVVLDEYIKFDGSVVGLAISQSMILTGMLTYGMRETAEVINQLTSVERVLEYTTIRQEGPFETDEVNVPETPWPTTGRIEFRNLTLRYAEDDRAALNNLSFFIEDGQKIGIVGRTGAGKSSLISALFRLSPTLGELLIDDLDTKKLGLSDLRRNISIIPQEPVLFSSTLRYNLDPFGEYEDKEIWNALEQVGLKDSVASLDFQVAGGGGNFSAGERQLICLARAVLRDNKILILDEATANVDLRTDSFIQSTIRSRFEDCTVLTIAHRLNTIMDSDKVLVMNFGEMVEFDHPHKLLQIEGGFFYKLVEETGPVMAQQLKDVALDAYQKAIQD